MDQLTKKKWSEAAVMLNRRKRMARRLYKKMPLFAVCAIQQRFGIEYDHAMFFEDQQLRKGYTRKARKGKRKHNGKADYLDRVKKQVKAAIREDDQPTLNRIMKKFYLVQANRSKPWAVQVRFADGQEVTYNLPCRLDENVIREFYKKAQEWVHLQDGETRIDALFDKLRQYGN